jgi:hypothetical protein
LKKNPVLGVSDINIEVLAFSHSFPGETVPDVDVFAISLK